MPNPVCPASFPDSPPGRSSVARVCQGQAHRCVPDASRWRHGGVPARPVTIGPPARLNIGGPYWPAGTLEGTDVDDRQKAVIVAVLAAVTGIGGVLAFEAVTGSQLGSSPAASSARGDVPGATTVAAGSEPLAERPAGTLPDCQAEPEAVADRRSAIEGDVVETTSGGQGIVRRVRRRDRCEEPVPRGHARVTCATRSPTATAGGRPPRWATRQRSDPLIAIDGNQAYVAYWRLLPYEPHDCGPDEPGPSAGVYYRWRTLPDGAWSKAIPFGKSGDHLQAFRVDGGVLHAIVWNGTSGRTVYIRSTQDPVASTRHGIDTDGDVSLRVGDDGRARVAYWGGGSLRYGTFDGSGFSTSKVANGPTDRPAMLVLGARNQPHVVYTIVPPIEGCGTYEPTSRTGTYYATLVNGTWTSQRITKKLGRPSIAVDPATGRVHVLVDERAAHEEPQQRLGLGTATRGGREPGDEAGPCDWGPARRLSPLEPRWRDRRVVRHHDSLTPGRSRRVVRRASESKGPRRRRGPLLLSRSGIDQRGGRVGRSRTDTSANTIKPPTTMSSRPSRPPGFAASPISVGGAVAGPAPDPGAVGAALGGAAASSKSQVSVASSIVSDTPST